MTTIPTALANALADRYRLERELGAGGMATVYLAHDLRHDRQVALKVLRPELAAVIHRDIKPENILLHDGQALVADFGIALAASTAGGTRMTETGMSLGTPHYMSPEQATGDRVIDGRSDIYSLAAVTYEMLTGEPPHTGSTAQAIFARVLTERPRSVRATRPSVPEHVDLALARALEKLRADRFATTHEFADALQGKSVAPSSLAGTAGSSSGAARTQRGWRGRIRDPVVIALAVVAFIGIGFGTWSRRAAGRKDIGTTVRFALSFAPTEHVVTTSRGTSVASSPDGKTVAYIGVGSSGIPQFFLRSLGELRARVVAGSEGSEQPFFSPDGKWVGFIAKQQLMKAPIDGGTRIPLTPVTSGVLGASWGPNDVIVISTQGRLAVVPAGGGAPRVFTTVDSAAEAALQVWPRVLADGKTVLYMSWRLSLPTARIGVASIRSGKTRILDSLPGTFPLGVFDGQLIYVGTTGALMAVPFDLRRVRPSGPPVLVVDGIAMGAIGSANAGLSPTGLLVYRSGSRSQQGVLVDRHGNARMVIQQARDYSYPRYSPDGKRIALTVTTMASTDVWIYEIASATLTRLTKRRHGERSSGVDARRKAAAVSFRSDWQSLALVAAGGPQRPGGAAPDSEWTGHLGGHPHARCARAHFSHRCTRECRDLVSASGR